MSVYALYTDGEPIGMDHPLFMARLQAKIDASAAAAAGVSLAEALRAIRERIRALFGDEPMALIDSAVSAEFAQHAARTATL